jgi:hypothetical protein
MQFAEDTSATARLEHAAPRKPVSGANYRHAESQSWFGNAAVFIRSKIVSILIVSAALLGPCFWQPFIHAGDLPSHLYNAWLAVLIKQGHAPGLWIARQWTNVAFDLALSWLLSTFGVGTAERIAVSVAVLIFFWGAFALVCTVSRQRPWFIAPCLGMLTYGWVFQMGFFNFYLSVGLSLFLLAIVWRSTLRDRIMAFPMLVLAWLAHPLPVMWLVAVATYTHIARKLSAKFQVAFFLVSLSVMFFLRQFLLGHFVARWSWGQLLLITGADQVWVFGRQYGLVALMILLLGGMLLLRQKSSCARIALRIPSQLYLLTAAGIFLLPTSVILHMYKDPPNLIAERMSLLLAVLACTVIAHAKPKKWHGVGFALAAMLYFCFLYLDAHAINRIENKIENLVSQLPPGQRVLALPALELSHGYAEVHAISRIESKIENLVSQLRFVRRVLLLPGSRINLDHIADRVCIGRCFSYGNYEPASEMFRIRALPGNAMVVWDREDEAAMGKGTYILKQSDIPIYQIYYCGRASTDVCIRALKMGEVNSAFSMPPRNLGSAR